MNKQKPIYVIGHKNPDTDAIVSAIGYAEFKKAKGINAVAGRIGAVSSETEYLLEKFGFEDPIHLYSAKSLLKEIDMDKAILGSKTMTMKEAVDKVTRLKNRSIFVADKTKHLQGIVTLDNLTYIWAKSDQELEQLTKTIKLENVVKILEGTLVLENPLSLSGKIHVFPTTKSNVEVDSIVLLRNTPEELEYCLDKGAKLVVVVTSSPIPKNIIKKAKVEGASIVSTKITPLSVTRLIFQIATIDNVMLPKDQIQYFTEDETVEEASKKIANTRFRSYPVLDENGRVVGSVSRYHLFNYQKKQFILVDHNEIKQSIDDIEHGEVLEIVDHHRFGGFETETPIAITTMPVGATSSIVAYKFFEAGIELDKNLAGLLLGGIVSDTMNFKSPTTTKLDLELAKKLEEISGASREELSKGIIENSASILNKRLIEVVYDDFKEFNINGNKVGLSQATCKSKDEYLAIEDKLEKYLEDNCKSNGYDLMVTMLTNPNGSGSYLVYAGTKKNAVYEEYSSKMRDNFVKELVSRKKQLLPALIASLNQ